MTIDWSAFTPWSALAGGILIGLGAGVFAVVNGRIAGISGLLGAMVQRDPEGRGEKGLFLLGLLAAPLVWVLFADWPRPEFQTDAWGLALAGLLVGIGTRYGGGCTSGHGVCGLSRWSLRSVAATVCFMSAGVATVYLIRHLWGG